MLFFLFSILLPIFVCLLYVTSILLAFVCAILPLFTGHDNRGVQINIVFTFSMGTLEVLTVLVLKFEQFHKLLPFRVSNNCWMC